MAAVYKVPGPVTVHWGGAAAAGTLLGTSKSGASISIADTWTSFTMDSMGQTPVDQIYTGRNIQVQFQGVDFTANGGFKAMLSSLMSLKMNAACGATLTTLGELLTITETPGGTGNIWTAAYAWPLLQGAIDLVSGRETVIPITFIIAPSAAGQHFTLVPTRVETV